MQRVLSYTQTQKRKAIGKRFALHENAVKNEIQKENVNRTNEPQTNTTDDNETKLQLFLQFSGKKGMQLLSKIKNS